MPVLLCLENWGMSANWTYISKIMGMDTKKWFKLLTLQLHIPHQTRSWSSVKTIWGLIYLEFSIFYPSVWMFKFTFHDGVNEVFSKELLKNQFWEPRNFTFCPYFLKFIKGQIFFKNWYGFWTLKVYILGSSNAWKDKWAHFEIRLSKIFIWWYYEVLNISWKNCLTSLNFSHCCERNMSSSINSYISQQNNNL